MGGVAAPSKYGAQQVVSAWPLPQGQGVEEMVSDKRVEQLKDKTPTAYNLPPLSLLMLG